MSNNNKTLKKRRSPDEYVVAFVILVVAFLLTYLIPVGFYQAVEETVTINGTEQVQTLVDPDSFQYLADESGNPARIPAKIFTNHYEEDGTGLINVMFNGFVNGGMDGNCGIIAFVLLIGGCFGILAYTGALDGGVQRLVKVMKGKDILLIPVLMVVMGFAGATMGLAEETIPLAMALIPVFVKIGYDSITGIMVIYVATMVGTSSSWMNPFILLVAQNIAGLAPMSGALLRIIVWFCVETPVIVLTIRRAIKVKKDPKSSFMYESDTKWFRNNTSEGEAAEAPFNLGHKLILLVFAAGVAWVVYGVVQKGYYIGQMAAQFFGTCVLVGVIGVIFKCNNMEINDIAKSFKQGVCDIAPAAIILAFAKGITLVMGGTDTFQPAIINTLVNSAGTLMRHVPTVISSELMYILTNIFNYLLPSGPAKAGMLMPIYAPLADIIGMTRQTACLAFQLGDGFCNMITPMSGVLMGILGAAHCDYVSWIKFFWKIFAMLFCIASVAIIAATMIGYV